MDFPSSDDLKRILGQYVESGFNNMREVRFPLTWTEPVVKQTTETLFKNILFIADSSTQNPAIIEALNELSVAGGFQLQKISSRLLYREEGDEKRITNQEGGGTKYPQDHPRMAKCE